MKTFEIEVVRTYTTTIEVEVPDTTTKEEVTNALYGLGKDDLLWEQIWDSIAYQELQQCDTDLIDHKIKEVYHEEFKSFNDAPYGQDDE